MRRIPEEVARWITAWGDKVSLGVPLPGNEYNRDAQAYRVIANTISEYEAEQTRKRVSELNQ